MRCNCSIYVSLAAVDTSLLMSYAGSGSHLVVVKEHLSLAVPYPCTLSRTHHFFQLSNS